jgi:hypothetical protein
VICPGCCKRVLRPDPEAIGIVLCGWVVNLAAGGLTRKTGPSVDELSGSNHHDPWSIPVDCVLTFQASAVYRGVRHGVGRLHGRAPGSDCLVNMMNESERP